MPSHIVSLSDAVVDELNNPANYGLFTHDFVAERRLTMVLDVAELAALKVSVLPIDMEDEIDTRADTQETITLGVTVQIKPPTDDVVYTDPYLDLAEAVANYFRGKTIDGYFCVSATLKPIFVPEHLIKSGVFSSVVQLILTANFAGVADNSVPGVAILSLVLGPAGGVFVIDASGPLLEISV